MTEDKKIAKEVKKLILSLRPLEVTELLGIFRMLNILVTDENGEPRPFEIVISEFIDEYIKLNRNQRRNLIALIEVATEKEKKKHTSKQKKKKKRG